MTISTRLAFKSLLRRFEADCVCDIGACDGSESLVFRQILPEAALVAFEANPYLFQKLANDSRFPTNRIGIYPYAIASSNGTAPFRVPDLDYVKADNKNPEIGTGSLLVFEGMKVKETVQVSTRRIDEFVLSHYPEARRIGLWIDAEGAEFEIIEGMTGIKDRVVALHVETHFLPRFPSQKLYSDVERSLKSMGFVPVCTNTAKDGLWGDVVFAAEGKLADLGWRYQFCKWAACLIGWCRIDSVGLFLKKHCYPLYRPLFRLYVRLFT